MLFRSPFHYQRRANKAVSNIGGQQVPVVIADMSHIEKLSPRSLESIGYTYDEATDKWHISDGAADFIFTGHTIPDFALPGTLKVIAYPATWADCGSP